MKSVVGEEGQAGWARRAGMVVACALCCALPMLVLVGAVSVGALVTGGAVVGSLVAVLAVTAAVASKRIQRTPDLLRLALFSVGGSAAFVGLWAAADQRPYAAVVISGGVAALAASALLALGQGASRDAPDEYPVAEPGSPGLRSPRGQEIE